MKNERVTEYLIFQVVDRTPNHKTQICYVLTRRDRMLLGTISYYGRWRQYTFSALSQSVVLNKGCLRDIADQCEVMTGEQRQRNRRR